MSESTRTNLVDDARQLVENSNRFAFDLYSKLAAGAEGNLFFSPSSIALALAMTYAGAAGQTAQEMADVLHFSLSPDRLHKAFRELQATTHKSGIELRIANRLWGQWGYHFLPEFLQTTEDYYGSRLAELDFSHATEKARLQINAWVEGQTANKITNLIPPGILNNLTRLVLTNAIYFLGSWDSEFNESTTRKAPFWGTIDNSHAVPMMRQTGTFSYAEFPSGQMLEMAYRQPEVEIGQFAAGHAQMVDNPADGSDFAMSIILPKARDGLHAIEARFTPSLAKKIDTLRPSRVDIRLPRFCFESQTFLNETLIALGMRQAFSNRDANFSRMSDAPPGLYIAAAIHKAFVDVNEQGTEAAAASAIGVTLRGYAQEPDPKLFLADHPFLFLIRDRRTGLIHFMGRVVTP